MATNHAAVIRAQGSANACAYCHQPVYCARCHGTEQVLPVTTPFQQGFLEGPALASDGISWPLLAHAATPAAPPALAPQGYARCSRPAGLTSGRTGGPGLCRTNPPPGGTLDASAA